MAGSADLGALEYLSYARGLQQMRAIGTINKQEFDSMFADAKIKMAQQKNNASKLKNKRLENHRKKVAKNKANASTRIQNQPKARQ